MVADGSSVFDASHYAFFGNHVVEEVELGGLEDEEEDFPLAGIKKRYINKVGLKCLAHMYFVSLL